MEQWGFYFDQTRCVGCKACVIACKAWNEGRRGDAAFNPELSWLESGRYAEPAEYDNLPGSEGGLNMREFARYHMKENWRRVTSRVYGTRPPDVDVLHFSVSCNHCSEPACTDACPMGRIVKEARFGIVRVDPEKSCIGCKLCQKACPWGSPQFWDEAVEAYAPGDPKRPLMSKCDLCLPRIEQGLKPACVAGCIMRALDAGPLDELKRRYPQAADCIGVFPDAAAAEPELAIKPNLIINLRRRRV
jgi:anaerobic dimethyl sulfoxide reductase subunit B (iron-sulfur subunit)